MLAFTIDVNARVLSSSELITYLGWSRRTLYRQIQAGLPFLDSGYRYVFEIGQVNEWLKARNQKWRRRKPLIVLRFNQALENE
ncbi:MerR family transcriptional regulator [Brevibacillus migulae]|uniref:helix-turn-helix domain-containing protein n=1 Tax=Brevibacillus migulae TaxID=1644114 RepID=UPI00106EDC64|nr:helix-turn-helix domain-containing protein [Brevibacillus migulae]